MFLSFVYEFFDCLEGLVADSMLDAAGIRRGDIFGHAEGDEKVGKDFVTAVNLFGNRTSLLGKGYVSVRVHLDVSSGLEQTDSAADTGL